MARVRRGGSVRLGALILLGVLLLAGCSFDASSALPFRAGTGEDSYQITVRMAQVANLVPNAEVKVGDITVGTVTKIEFDNWTAKLTVGLEPDVALPANATAKVGQKSLLGAEYLELASPSDMPPQGKIRDGEVIPLNRTGRYPETEDLLAALSVLLNNGGLSHLHTITSELNSALGGREAEARELIGNLGTFTQALETRKGDIVRAMENLNKLSGTVAEQRDVINTALDKIPPGLAALERQRESLTQTLNSMSSFGDAAVRVINGTSDDLQANLRSLQPTLQRLADSGTNLTRSMLLLPTFPFPANTAFPNVLKGDYGNLYITLDLNASKLSRDLLHGFTLANVPLLGSSSVAKGAQPTNPLSEIVGNATEPLMPDKERDSLQSPYGPLGRLLGGITGGNQQPAGQPDQPQGGGR